MMFDLTGKVAVVTDSGADIPEDEMDRLDIHMVPLRVHFGDKGYLDRVGITRRRLLRAGGQRREGGGQCEHAGEQGGEAQVRQGHQKR